VYLDGRGTDQGQSRLDHCQSSLVRIYEGMATEEGKVG